MPEIRVLVAIEFVNGGRQQAACRTEGCTGGADGGPWRGGIHRTRDMPDQEANWHRIGYHGWVAPHV